MELRELRFKETVFLYNIVKEVGGEENNLKSNYKKRPRSTKKRQKKIIKKLEKVAPKTQNIMILWQYNRVLGLILKANN